MKYLLLALAGTLLIIGLAGSVRRTKRRADWPDAIRAVVVEGRDRGWVEAFDARRRQPLAAHDPRWKPIFGQLLIQPRQGAIGDPDGGWQRDGGDDYAFRDSVLEGNVEIVVDGWWDGQGSIGALAMVQSAPPHRLYEAALFRGRLTLFYFIGPAPDQYVILGASPEPPVGSGHYRIVLRLQRTADQWRIAGRLLDPARQYAPVAEVIATDGRLTSGGPGIGILGGTSFITGMAVREVP